MVLLVQDAFISFEDVLLACFGGYNVQAWWWCHTEVPDRGGVVLVKNCHASGIELAVVDKCFQPRFGSCKELSVLLFYPFELLFVEQLEALSVGTDWQP